MRLPLSIAVTLLACVSPVIAGSIDQFPLPRTGSEVPLAVAPADSFAWVASAERAAIAKVSFTGDVQSVFTLPSYYPFVIVTDPSDNSVWYVTYTQLGHLTPAGQITEFPLNSFRQPNDIILGPDNNIWIAMSDSIVRVTRTGQIREFSVRDLGLDPYRMAVGSDGNIWITCHYAVVVAMITPNGELTAYHNVTSGEYINGIAAGPDTNMYFSCNQGELHMITLGGTPVLITAPPNPIGDGPYRGADDKFWWADATGASGVHNRLQRYDPTARTLGPDYVPTGQFVNVIPRPGSLAAGVWYTVSSTSRIGRVTYDGTQSEWSFLTKAGTPGALVAGPNETLWFTEPNDNRIGRMNLSDHSMTELTLPVISAKPRAITQGSDGAMWFTEEDGDEIGRVTVDGALSRFTIPWPYGKPNGITTGPDGNLWFTLAASGMIVRLTPAGNFTNFLLPSASCSPTSITTGPDGNLWFTENAANRIGRITTSGVVTEFIVPLSPHSIISGPDGNLWFLTLAGISRLTPAGNRLDFDIQSGAEDLTVGPDGNLWYTMSCCGFLGRMTTSGASTTVYVGGTSPIAIATGGDGNIWCSDKTGQSLMRVIPGRPVVAAAATFCLDSSNRFDGIVASFTDPDARATAFDYQATINWGDNTSGDGTIETASGGGFNVRGTHTYRLPAIYTTKTTISGLPRGYDTGTGPAQVTGSAVGIAGFIRFIQPQCDNGFMTAIADTNVTAATYSWTISGGTIVAGNGSAQIRVRVNPSAFYPPPPIELWVQITASGCSTVLHAGPITVACTGWTAGDFNGDGSADILWHNVASGQNYVYRMNGLTIASQDFVTTVADPQWRIAGTGDFDGDGNVDILWRNHETGQNYIYLMHGSVIGPNGPINTIADLSWDVAGIGDFNHDGKADILWRNTSSGLNYIYLMNGMAITDQLLLNQVPDQAWHVVAVADFDGDGEADILWRNSNTGQNYIYRIQSGAIAENGPIVTLADQNWIVAGTGDFNGDGRADILWHNMATGATYIYYMYGLSVLQQDYVNTVADTNWKIAAVADYNGDRIADILWRNDVTGQNYMYIMNGSAIGANGPINTVPDPNWKVIGN